MERRFDLVVVGTGVASAVTSRCREAGWSVAVVDSRPFGGTCALRGCVPKKILVGAAEAVHHARDMAAIGVPAAGLTIDWPALMRFKRSVIDATPERTEQGWAKIGVEQFHGRARFVDSTTLAVGDDRLIGRRVLIAAGAMPAPLRFPGADRLATSEDFLNLDRMPARVVFVGGGYISFEFAHVAARAGADVTIVHRGARPLEGFDPDLVELLVRRTRELGMRVELNTEVLGVDRAAGGLVVRGLQHGTERAFEADLVVHGAGRVPELDDLDLDRARRQAREAGHHRQRVPAIRLQPRRLCGWRFCRERTGPHAKGRPRCRRGCEQPPPRQPSRRELRRDRVGGVHDSASGVRGPHRGRGTRGWIHVPHEVAGHRLVVQHAPGRRDRRRVSRC